IHRRRQQKEAKEPFHQILRKQLILYPRAGRGGMRAPVGFASCKPFETGWQPCTDRGDNRHLKLIATLALLWASMLAAKSHLGNGIALQQAGKLQEADHELRAAIAELSASADRANLLQALSIESWISVSLGNNEEAIRQASRAVQLRTALDDRKHLGDDLN